MLDHVRRQHEQLETFLKGGESSDIKPLGKTKSGKNVWDDFDHEEHKDYSSQDHRDAADILQESLKSAKGKFPGNIRAARNKHHDAALDKGKKEEKLKLKNLPSEGDYITSSEGFTGSVKHRDETHTYIEHKTSQGQTKISKLPNEEVDGKISAGNFKHHKPVNVKKSENDDLIKGALDNLLKGNEELFEKGGPGSGRHPLHEKLNNYLNKFPDNATFWSQTTDEVRDLARSAKEHYNEMDLDKLNDEEGAHPAHNFREHKTPSDWNTKGKQYIRDTVDKMSDQTKSAFLERHGDLLNGKLEKSIQDEINTFEKGGKPAVIGEIRTFAGREHIRTADGWKYHGKGGGQMAQNHSNNAIATGHTVGTSDNQPTQHAQEALEKQRLREEGERLAKEKMGDINFRFKMFAAAVKGVISGKFKSAIGYGTGGVGKTYTVTGQLQAAGKVPFDEELHQPAHLIPKEADEDDEDFIPDEGGDKSDQYDYVKVTGKMTAPQVYKTLYEHNGKIILFDDCDSVLTDGAAVNLFKGALDTSGDGTIQYATSGGVKGSDGEKLPQRFKFNGRCIFISNLAPQSMPQPLKSRAVGVDLTMDKKQTMDRIRTIATHPKTGKYENLHFPGISKYSHNDLKEVIDYLDKHRDYVHDLNVRTIGKILGLKQIADEMGESKDWEKYADQTIFSKGESFDLFKGGVMEIQKARMASCYDKSNRQLSDKMKKSWSTSVDRAKEVKSDCNCDDENELMKNDK